MITAKEDAASLSRRQYEIGDGILISFNKCLLVKLKIIAQKYSSSDSSPDPLLLSLLLQKMLNIQDGPVMIAHYCTLLASSINLYQYFEFLRWVCN